MQTIVRNATLPYLLHPLALSVPMAVSATGLFAQPARRRAVLARPVRQMTASFVPAVTTL